MSRTDVGGHYRPQPTPALVVWDGSQVPNTPENVVEANGERHMLGRNEPMRRIAALDQLEASPARAPVSRFCVSTTLYVTPILLA